MLHEPITVPESILGYNLKSRLGAGGYGEVWTAEAPGGLLKAVKLIYGYHDGNRAQRELKALNRIKEVRHAFLLSLERIEVVDGRLIVVTELAEKCLKDRFNECLEAGLTGIPRDEILGYVSDAAEALDYLSDVHSLQHLDIKPENLLLIGGHVKVADFGLVKDMHDASQSIMAGLTPTYAPPELFDGHPSRFSDQYSLAIVFQEMLTGTRPFSGKTAAQLAAQHLHGKPTLARLSQADQNAIRRALSKNPEARFPDCREFVNELKQKRVRRGLSNGSDAGTGANSREDTPAGTMTISPGKLAALAAKMVERRMPPATIVAEDEGLRPTLFIGIGETATGVVRRVKSRLRERIGDVEQVPALRVLCIDTDTRDLDRAVLGNATNTLRCDEVLGVPLRSSTDYRARSSLGLGWLSRRWIYNVPKSLQTEGLRPLGRLAFVDHHESIFRRLTRIVGEMSAKSAVEESARRLEMSPNDRAPRIVIVASISGGVGSGMVADVAYAARTVLGEAGFPDAHVDGLLMYSLGRSSTRRDLTAANAFTCLNELYHYGYAAGFPGDESCDLPEFADVPPFDNTYLVDLGNDPLPDEYEAMSDVLAEYLYLDAATACGACFEACRRADRVDDGHFMVRTLGVGRAGRAGGDLLSIPGSILSNALLRYWLGTTNDASFNDEADLKAATMVSRANLTCESLLTVFDDAVKHRFGQSIGQLVRQAVASSILDIGAPVERLNGEVLVQQVESVVSACLGTNGVGGSPGRFSARLDDLLISTADEVANQLAGQINQDIILELNSDRPRVQYATTVWSKCLTRIQQLADQVGHMAELATKDVAERLSHLRAFCDQPRTQLIDEVQSRGDLERRIEAYGIARSGLLRLTVAKRCIAALSKQVDGLSAFFRDLRKEIERLAEEFTNRSLEEQRITAITGDSLAGRLRWMLEQHLSQHRQRLVVELNRQVQQGLEQTQQSFSRMACERADDLRERLERLIYRGARQIASQALETVGIDQLLSDSLISPEQIKEWLQATVGQSTPHLLQMCGGASRLVVAVPRGKKWSAVGGVVDEFIGVQSQVIEVANADIAVCCEAGQIPATQVAAALLYNCPESVDLITRLNTRTDIDWVPIIRVD